MIPDVSGLSNLMGASIRVAIGTKNPKLLGLLMKLVLLLADKRQPAETTHNGIFESCLLKSSVDACQLCDGKRSLAESSHGEPYETSTSNQGDLGECNQEMQKSGPNQPTAVCLGLGLKRLFSHISEILPEILPATSGCSQQAIEFLRSQNLLIQYAGFQVVSDPILKRFEHYGGISCSEKTTTISADSVICAVSETMVMGRAFDHVWMPFSLDRLCLYPFKDWLENKNLSYLSRIIFMLLGFLASLIVIPIFASVLALYPLVVIYVYIMHGFNMYTTPNKNQLEITFSEKEAEHSEKQNLESSLQAGASGKPKHADGSGDPDHPGTPGHTNYCMWAMKGLMAVLYRPVESLIESLKGNQSVVGHVLCLPGVGSFKSLKILLTAPIDVFETPAVRAAVEGAWSRFVLGFYVRFALFLVQLLLFSAFASWCIAQDLSYSRMDASQDEITKSSFIGGCVAAVIGFYFLVREVLQCCACIADEGLKKYIEFWNVVQVCSHSLEIVSLAMFVLESDPINTRIVATYAIFSLWINVLYFTKAIRQISFLLEILTTIISDMIPFVFIMIILVLADTFALLVLVGNVKDPDNEEGKVMFASFGTPLDLVARMAEGRQDLGGSSLESLATEVLKQNNIGLDAQNAIACTIYLCCYFLFFIITIVALNASIALMGSSYEKVMEKKISQRYKLLAQIIVDEMRIMRMNILRWEALHRLLGSMKILPRRLDDYEAMTKYTHILSASSDGKEPNDNLEIWDGKQGDEWTGQMDSVKRQLRVQMRKLEGKMGVLEGKMDKILEFFLSERPDGVQPA